jgi:hypothetical protein
MSTASTQQPSASRKRILCVVGSKNVEKANAVFESCSRVFRDSCVEVVTYDASPGITEWKSELAIGQPFGCKQTAYGATRRARDAMKQHQAEKHKQQQPSEEEETVLYFGIENGIVPADQVKTVTTSSDVRGYDLAYVALLEDGVVSIKQSAIAVRTPMDMTHYYNSDDDGKERNPVGFTTVVQDTKCKDDPSAITVEQRKILFDEAVVAYRNTVMPQIERGKDLYIEWSNGAVSRRSVLAETVTALLHERTCMQYAKQEVLAKCLQWHCSASSGPRYAHMLWTRDLAYMMRGYWVYFQSLRQQLNQNTCPGDNSHSKNTLSSTLKQDNSNSTTPAENSNNNSIITIRTNDCERMLPQECEHALAALAMFQTAHSSHPIRNNGYETQDCFGQIPIVCLPTEEEEVCFLQNRLQMWQQKLLGYALSVHQFQPRAWRSLLQLLLPGSIVAKVVLPELELDDAKLQQFIDGLRTDQASSKADGESETDPELLQERGEFAVSSLNSIPLLHQYYAALKRVANALSSVFQNHRQDFPVASQPPTASFSLRRYFADVEMAENAAADDSRDNTYVHQHFHQLTPGTRDAEIQYMRAVFQWLDLNFEDKGKHTDPKRKIGAIQLCSPSLAQALFYVYNNLVNPENGLPRGADSRDIFADALYDAHLLSNAVFLHQVLSGFVRYSAMLFEDDSFLDEWQPAFQHRFRTANSDTDIIKKDFVQTLFPFSTITPVNADSFQAQFVRSRNLLTEAIFKRFVVPCCCAEEPNIVIGKQGSAQHQKPTVQLLDFIPGLKTFEIHQQIQDKASIAPMLQLNPVIDIVHESNPLFFLGKQPDPHSVAQLILTPELCATFANQTKNLVYDAALACWIENDSPIGVLSFVPISAQNEKEHRVLRQVKGRVMWTYVNWLIVRACLTINTSRSLRFAEQLRDKLLHVLPSPCCAEWYACTAANDSSTNDDNTVKTIIGRKQAINNVTAGGDPCQGWSASTMLEASYDLASFYESSKSE